MPPEIAALLDAYDAVERDARALVSGLTPAQGVWRLRPEAWSIAECLDHLAVGNRVYVDAMQPVADRGRREGRLRRGPARPGFFGGLFVRSLEPPPAWYSRVPAPRHIRPRPAPPLDDAAGVFFDAHARSRCFVEDVADLDVTGLRFHNPFVRGVWFSLATGMHVTPAHERRHLWQAWNVRRTLTS